MKVFVAHDGRLRVRIGHENLGSESLGSWYGGTGAIRLRQVHGDWFRAYKLDDHGHRGTAALPEEELWRVREHLPGARAMASPGGGLGVRVPEDDLRMLHDRVVPLRTRVARFGEGVVVLFGDFQIERSAGASSGLFHLGGNRFNAFRTGSRWSALDAGGVAPIAARLPSARLRREGEMSVVEVGDADLALLLRMAGGT